MQKKVNEGIFEKPGIHPKTLNCKFKKLLVRFIVVLFNLVWFGEAALGCVSTAWPEPLGSSL